MTPHFLIPSRPFDLQCSCATHTVEKRISTFFILSARDRRNLEEADNTQFLGISLAIQKSVSQTLSKGLQSTKFCLASMGGKEKTVTQMTPTPHWHSIF